MVLWLRAVSTSLSKEIDIHCLLCRILERSGQVKRQSTHCICLINGCEVVSGYQIVPEKDRCKFRGNATDVLLFTAANAQEERKKNSGIKINFISFH